MKLYYSLDKQARLECELGVYDFPLHPKRKNPTDAGIDLFSFGNYIIYPNEYKIVRTGVNFMLPDGTMGLVKPKSKNNYLIGAGVVDQNYRGEILVKIFNPLRDTINIKHGDEICQLIIIPILTPELELLDGLPTDTDRGITGGIASQLINMKEEK